MPNTLILSLFILCTYMTACKNSISEDYIELARECSVSAHSVNSYRLVRPNNGPSSIEAWITSEDFSGRLSVNVSSSGCIALNKSMGPFLVIYQKDRNQFKVLRVSELPIGQVVEVNLIENTWPKSTLSCDGQDV